MNILVLGASGGCGRHLVSQGVERGHHVTALVREQTQFDAPQGVNVLRGDPLDVAVVARAAQGQALLLSALGIKRANARNPWSKLVSPTDFASHTARNIIEGARANGISRIIAISAAGVAESAPRMNGVMRWLVNQSNVGVAYRDLAAMETVYSQSELDWTCVRPVTLTDGKLTRGAKYTDYFGTMATISRADVACWMLDAAEGKASPETRTPMISS